jgi:hypothetical protein
MVVGSMSKWLIAPVYIKSRQRSSISSVRINDKLFHTAEGTIGKCKLDTHADTCVAGAKKS